MNRSAPTSEPVPRPAHRGHGPGPMLQPFGSTSLSPIDLPALVRPGRARRTREGCTNPGAARRTKRYRMFKPRRVRRVASERAPGGKQPRPLVGQYYLARQGYGLAQKACSRPSAELRKGLQRVPGPKGFAMRARGRGRIYSGQQGGTRRRLGWSSAPVKSTPWASGIASRMLRE
jgi:hypothetical protein